MQTTLAGNAAAREEARVQRASQEGRPASADDAYPSGKGKRLSGAVAAPVDVNATYHDGDDADAYFEENGQLIVQADCAGELMMPFSGFYDDVSYPITTLFYPPQAPGDMPPRVQPPRRPGPQYLNDLALAGDVENDAQTMVSKIWRGIMTRRNLHNSRTHDHIVNARARMAQCWWRCVIANRRASQLRTLKAQWVEERAASYLAEKKKGLANMMTWQRSRFEGAAIKLQRTVRWFLRRCQRQRCAEEGLPEDQWPEELPFPVPHKVTRYFWWRRTTAEKAALAAAEAAAMGLEAPEDGALVEKGTGEEAPRRTTILEFKKEREPVPPPPQSEVEKTNADMRRRTRSRALSLAQPEAQSRREWKQEGLKHEDLDFNAGVIQRLYRSKRSESKVRTVELTKTYMDNVVRIISRTFRMYLLVQRLKSARFSQQRRVEEKLKNYSKAKIAEVEHKMVWGKDLLDAAARTIQQCWHWYRHTRFGILPLRIQKQIDHRKALEDKKQQIIDDRRRVRRETIRQLQEELGVDALPEGADAADNEKVDETVEGDEFAELEESFEVVNPTKPPYHLIDAYLAREEELRDAMMTLLDRNAKEMASRRTYVKFTPKNVINRNGRYTFIAKEKS